MMTWPCSYEHWSIIFLKIDSKQPKKSPTKHDLILLEYLSYWSECKRKIDFIDNGNWLFDQQDPYNNDEVPIYFEGNTSKENNNLYC